MEVSASCSLPCSRRLWRAGWGWEGGGGERKRLKKCLKGAQKKKKKKKPARAHAQLRQPQLHAQPQKGALFLPAPLHRVRAQRHLRIQAARDAAKRVNYGAHHARGARLWDGGKQGAQQARQQRAQGRHVALLHVQASELCNSELLDADGILCEGGWGWGRGRGRVGVCVRSGARQEAVFSTIGRTMLEQRAQCRYLS